MSPENDIENPFIAILQGIEKLADKHVENFEDIGEDINLFNDEDFDNDVLEFSYAEDKEYKPEDLII